jgi:glycosyltransferase involved in cell wall biosynthesis
MESYLSHCLDSLLIPNIEDVEILVVNDGSNDSTSEIGHRYESMHPNSIRVIDKENGHYGSCINRGLIEASGKYIRILDADDSFESNAFDEYVSFLKRQDADLVVSDYSIVNEHGTKVETRVLLPQNLSYGTEIPFDRAIETLNLRLMAMHGVAYKTDNLRKLKYEQTEGVSYTDQEWIFLPIIMVNTVSYFPKTVYKYLVGREGQSISSSVMRKNVSVQLQLINKRLELYKKLKDEITEAQTRYLRYRLRMPIVNTYCMVLYSKSLSDYLSDISDLDSRLKHVDRYLYDQIGECKYSRLNLRIIKIWRCHNREISKSVLLKVIRSFNRK